MYSFGSKGGGGGGQLSSFTSLANPVSITLPTHTPRIVDVTTTANTPSMSQLAGSTVTPSLSQLACTTTPSLSQLAGSTATPSLSQLASATTPSLSQLADNTVTPSLSQLAVTKTTFSLSQVAATTAPSLSQLASTPTPSLSQLAAATATPTLSQLAASASATASNPTLSQLAATAGIKGPFSLQFTKSGTPLSHVTAKPLSTAGTLTLSQSASVINSAPISSLLGAPGNATIFVAPSICSSAIPTDPITQALAKAQPSRSNYSKQSNIASSTSRSINQPSAPSLASMSITDNHRTIATSNDNKVNPKEPSVTNTRNSTTTAEHASTTFPSAFSRHLCEEDEEDVSNVNSFNFFQADDVIFLFDRLAVVHPKGPVRPFDFQLPSPDQVVQQARDSAKGSIVIIHIDKRIEIMHICLITIVPTYYRTVTMIDVDLAAASFLLASLLPDYVSIQYLIAFSEFPCSC
jgi:hypothetical protein